MGTTSVSIRNRIRSASRLSGRQAFTLVELLVVIGIIAVLISVLLPALGKVRAQAKVAQCMSNARQIGHALMNYANAHQGWLPYSSQITATTIAGVTYPGDWLHWAERLAGHDSSAPSSGKLASEPFLRWRNNNANQAWHCPLAREQICPAGPGLNSLTYVGGHFATNYALNSFLSGTANGRVSGTPRYDWTSGYGGNNANWKRVPTPNTPHTASARIGRIRNASGIALVSEAPPDSNSMSGAFQANYAFAPVFNHRGEDALGAWVSAGNLAPWPLRRQVPLSNTLLTGTVRPKVHNDVLPIIFADGHGEIVRQLTVAMVKPAN